MHEQDCLETPFVNAGSSTHSRTCRPAMQIAFVTMAVVGIVIVAFVGGEEVAPSLQAVSSAQERSHVQEMNLADPEPFAEEEQGGILTVQQQWMMTIAFWAISVIWYPIFCLDLFPSDTTAGFLINNIVPTLLLPLIGFPVAQGLIAYEIPIVGLVLFALLLLAPFLCYKCNCLLPFLIGYLGSFPMSFCFYAIHEAGVADTSNESFNWIATYIQPLALASINAVLYKWQFWSKCPLNYKVRWAVLGGLGIAYAEKALVEVIKQLMGQTAFDPTEFSTYKLTPVQYIRLNSIRVMILLACFSFMRTLEEMACPKKKCEIGKGWCYEPFTKIVPVAQF